MAPTGIGWKRKAMRIIKSTILGLRNFEFFMIYSTVSYVEMRYIMSYDIRIILESKSEPKQTRKRNFAEHYITRKIEDFTENSLGTCPTHA